MLTTVMSNQLRYLDDGGSIVHDVRGGGAKHSERHWWACWPGFATSSLQTLGTPTEEPVNCMKCLAEAPVAVFTIKAVLEVDVHEAELPGVLGEAAYLETSNDDAEASDP
jgi:hypothetical protein